MCVCVIGAVTESSTKYHMKALELHKADPARKPCRKILKKKHFKKSERSSSGVSGGSLHRGASFKIEKTNFAA